MELLTKEVLDEVRGESGLNEQRVREAIEHLKDWIQLQHHLPKEIGTFHKDTVNCTTLFMTVDSLSPVENNYEKYALTELGLLQNKQLKTNILNVPT